MKYDTIEEYDLDMKKFEKMMEAMARDPKQQEIDAERCEKSMMNVARLSRKFSQK